MDVAQLVNVGCGGGGSVGLPRDLILDSGIVVEGFENAGDWSANSGSVANNAVQYRQGTQSIKLTSVIGGDGTMTKIISLAGLDGRMRLSVYQQGNLTNKQATIYISSVSNWSKHFSYQFTLTGYDEWSEINIVPTDWTKVGGESWANTMIRLRLSFTAAAGETQSISFDNLRSKVVGVPAVAIGCSHPNYTLYQQAFPYALAHKFRITVNPVTSHIGTSPPDNVTWAMLEDMYSSGMCIASHSQTHDDLDVLSQAECEVLINGAITDLNAQGISGNSGLYFVPPGAGADTETRAALVAVGIRSSHNNAYPQVNRFTALPVGYALDMPVYALSSAITLAVAKARVDMAVTRKELIILGFDRLEVSPLGAQWAIADWISLMDYIISLRLPILTDEDIYNLSLGSTGIPRAR